MESCMDKVADLLVIGGGAAGMVAAITAARLGVQVRVVERMSRVGKKLLATGNGRCNLTNMKLDISRFHGGGVADFARVALERFDVKQTLAFFEELGVLTKEEDAGRLFPITDQATTILDVLRYEMDRLDVDIVGDANINRVEYKKNLFACYTAEGTEFHAKRVLLATGGKSYPNLGSNGGGFKIAAALGHHVVNPWPVIVQVKLAVPFLKQLDGLQIQAEVSALKNGAIQQKSRGEALFTDYGLSGDAVLNVSRVVSESYREGHEANAGKVEIQLDMFPDKSEAEMLDLLLKRFAAQPQKQLDFAMVGLLHKRLIPVVLKEAGCTDLRVLCGQVDRPCVGKIAAILKRWRLPAIGTLSWMHAKVTAGGVDLREVNAQTLESRLVPGLYFAGEVLDVDGDSGGFNLQWAWSSARLAAQAAALAQTR
ncbi:TPA: aminoacetone oxidase family FAD-binding enzyme [Candidatus Sumerlaeota bacterium]|nr:aminoacetone oxidase family FAD-binding enzyme [Candidatus Sumerlaeota bacterium]